MRCNGLPNTYVPSDVRNYLHMWLLDSQRCNDSERNWLLTTNEVSVLTQDYRVVNMTRSHLKQQQHNMGDIYTKRVVEVLGVNSIKYTNSNIDNSIKIFRYCVNSANPFRTQSTCPCPSETTSTISNTISEQIFRNISTSFHIKFYQILTATWSNTFWSIYCLDEIYICCDVFQLGWTFAGVAQIWVSSIQIAIVDNARGTFAPFVFSNVIFSCF